MKNGLNILESAKANQISRILVAVLTKAFLETTINFLKTLLIQIYVFECPHQLCLAVWLFAFNDLHRPYFLILNAFLKCIYCDSMQYDVK